jgi:hypothetical protein
LARLVAVHIVDTTLLLNYASIKERATIKAETMAEAMNLTVLSRMRVRVRDGEESKRLSTSYE